jgi:hypothetical protein
MAAERGESPRTSSRFNSPAGATLRACRASLTVSRQRRLPGPWTSDISVFQ